MTVATTDGSPSECVVCGKKVWIQPASESGDATCPHCGSLLWFSEILENDTLRDLRRRGVDTELNEQGEVIVLRFFGDVYDDSTVPKLAKLMGIARINVTYTALTEAGVAGLRAGLPNVEVVWRDSHRP